MISRNSYHSPTAIIATIAVFFIIIISSYSGLTQSRNGFIDNAGLYYPVFTESVGIGILAMGIAYSMYEKSPRRVIAALKIVLLLIGWLGACALIAVYARQDIVTLYQKLAAVFGIPGGIILLLHLLKHVKNRLRR